MNEKQPIESHGWFYIFLLSNSSFFLQFIMQRSIAYFSDTRFLDHRTPPGHPERVDRLVRLNEVLLSTPMWKHLLHCTPDAASIEQMLAVHTQEHLDHVRNTCANGGGMLDEGDTHACADSFTVALLAAGAVVGAVDSVLQKKAHSAFCAVRPPGHHAERNRSMGFCLFNNVAIGARYAQSAHGLRRIAILDWDVHHGNGTQHIFEEDDSVLYASLHQYPFYPGTGARTERGVDRGEGFTLNIPLPAETGENRYVEAFKEEINPRLLQFRPEILFLSAGFDAHKDDPLGGMRLTENSFAKMTTLVRDIAPVVSVLEGGYNLDALAHSVHEHLIALAS